jgi:hypothetical protein
MLKKFISISEAFAELRNTLLLQSELKKPEELEPFLSKLEDLQNGKIQVHPMRPIAALICQTPIRHLCLILM